MRSQFVAKAKEEGVSPLVKTQQTLGQAEAADPATDGETDVDDSNHLPPRTCVYLSQLFYRVDASDGQQDDLLTVDQVTMLLSDKSFALRYGRQDDFPKKT